MGLCAVCLLGTPAADAQLSVIDTASVSQLITQARMLQDQLSTARDHLARAEEQLRSLHGTRGMERLLAGTERNYLPEDWRQIQALLSSGEPAYTSLSLHLRQTLAANTLLPEARLADFPGNTREHIEAVRWSAAVLQVLTHEALATISGRFLSLQRLIDAIPDAADPKAILDLQARIGAEQGMLQNEQNKLQTLYQAAHAQTLVDRQRQRENVIAGHGRFERRFQPTPDSFPSP
ncbi:conjugal transfer protein TrbF [Steroidobacter denitrificans]|uniref:Conjugal transfer protein TrbF n=1 Tax=Steroidobacter denitrificans TaxID=465721 RepID=A0A127FCU8_STEDE|nr:conjugal transfer protein TrbF [Steroidobacter denitrificans]